MNSSNSSNEIGEGVILDPSPNSKKKQISPAKRWCFVLNNYTKEECSSIVPLIKEHCEKAIASFEVGEECGTPHVQGFLSFIKKKRPLEVFTFTNRIKWILAKGDDKSQVKYINKERRGHLISFGMPKEKKPIKILTNLYPWQKEIEDLYMTEPHPRHVHWFWEATGGVGKSDFVKYMVIKHGALFCDGGKKADLINLVFNADMDECKCIIWDIPKVNKNNISYSTVESVKNGLVCNTKFETGVKAFERPHIFIFANYPPDVSDNLSADKWIVKELKL